MNRTLIAAATLSFVALAFSPLSARERQSSGSYDGSGGSGSWRSDTTRSKGTMHRSSTADGPRGERRRDANRTWDRKSGTGTYSSKSTGPHGKSTSREGTVKKTGDGTYQREGTVTGPNGHTANVDSTSTRNPDGSRTVDTTRTNEEGQSITSNKTITHDENGRTAEGSYSTSGGKTGTFNRSRKVTH